MPIGIQGGLGRSSPSRCWSSRPGRNADRHSRRVGTVIQALCGLVVCSSQCRSAFKAGWDGSPVCRRGVDGWRRNADRHSRRVGTCEVLGVLEAACRRNADRHSRRVGTRCHEVALTDTCDVAMPIGIQGGLGPLRRRALRRNSGCRNADRHSRRVGTIAQLVVNMIEGRRNADRHSRRVGTP